MEDPSFFFKRTSFFLFFFSSKRVPASHSLSIWLWICVFAIQIITTNPTCHSTLVYFSFELVVDCLYSHYSFKITKTFGRGGKAIFGSHRWAGSSSEYCLVTSSALSSQYQNLVIFHVKVDFIPKYHIFTLVIRLFRFNVIVYLLKFSWSWC